MRKKLLAIVLVIAVLLGISGCGMQEQETDSIGSNLKQIREGIQSTDGIADTYISDITAELTSYNYKKLPIDSNFNRNI